MNNNQISYQQELLRKTIHLCSLSLPLLYYYTDKETTLSFIIPLFLLVLIFDIFSKKGKILHNFVFKYFGSMLREHEKKDGLVLNGASWVLISALLVFAVFPKILAITSFIILIISDLSAALIGRRFGKHKLFDKSWEGTIAFFISASFIIFFIWSILPDRNIYFLYFGLFASMISAFTELVSNIIKVDDNISVPTSFCITMWLLNEIAIDNGASFLNLM